MSKNITETEEQLFDAMRHGVVRTENLRQVYPGKTMKGVLKRIEFQTGCTVHKARVGSGPSVYSFDPDAIRERQKDELLPIMKDRHAELLRILETPTLAADIRRRFGEADANVANRMTDLGIVRKIRMRKSTGRFLQAYVANEK